MPAIFADTYYYLALLNRRDGDHQRVLDFTLDYDGTMLTTEWVLTEVADGLSRAGTRGHAVALVTDVRQDPDVRIVAADRALFDRGFAMYAGRPDKDWSLTDCISFVVMREHHITDALTADHHFEQAGFAALLK